jgi:RimJ/RimL family protein N-acetyltransferase
VELTVTNPFPFEALPRVWAWIAPFRERICDDFSPQTQDAFVAGMAAKWQGYAATWAIRAGGELGGLVTFERLTPHLGTAHIVVKHDFHGKGVAVRAARIAVSEMFALGIGKLALYPLEGNLALGSLHANLGAKREGCLKGHTLRGGKPIDVWVYGLSREQFEGTQGVSGVSGVTIQRGGAENAEATQSG